MSGLDVEALLDSTANGPAATSNDKDRREHDRERERDRERREPSKDRDRRDRSRDRRRHEDDRPRKARSPDARPRHDQRSSGDFYRGGGRPHTRSRSPDRDRFYRPSGRDRRDRDDRPVRPRDDRDRARDGRRRSRSRRRTPEPVLTEEERDKRTVFVQQLAARLRTKELIAFFEKIGPVKEAQIVKDRISGRSKGVGYVEFRSESSVIPAISLTGQKLLGIPIIAQLTEAEKNRIAHASEAPATTSGGPPSNGTTNGVPFHRLYVGNIHFSITESDIQNIFEPFGELEFVQLQMEDGGRSRGYGFVQFRDANSAREALEKMNGFELAGRPIRVGLGNDKFTAESTATMMQQFEEGGADGHESSPGRSRGHDRERDDDKDRGRGRAGALDDSEAGGVNLNNYSRDSLMRKLARDDDAPPPSSRRDRDRDRDRLETRRHRYDVRPLETSTTGRCVVLRNMFDPSKEEGDDWVKELEDDVRAECEDKYGHVVHIAIDPNTAGDIYIKFDREQGGENACKGLNGRYFGGRMISAQRVVEAVYSSLWSKSKDV